MKPTYKHNLKMVGLLFVAFLLVYGIGLPMLILLGMPLIRWVIHGVLHFSIDSRSLWWLAWLVLGMTVVTTVLMWLEGKWKGRW
jgi:hypothetical protein